MEYTLRSRVVVQNLTKKSVNPFWLGKWVKFQFLLCDADMHSAYLLRRRDWVAGWLAGCPSHSGIVSKRLNLS